MRRPWLRDGDRDAAGDVPGEADGGDPPSDAVAPCTPFPMLGPPWPDDDAEDAEIVPFPTLDPPRSDGAAVDVDDVADVDEAEDVGGEPFPALGPPWPDGGAADVDDADGVRFPALGPGPGRDPSSSEAAPCRVPHRPVRPVHRRRSRHSFEPEDLSDAELDRLLRGARPGDGPAQRRSSTGARTWSAWVKFALAASVLLVVVGGVVGVITAAAGGTTGTVTTRGQGRPPSTTAPPHAADQFPTAHLAKTGQPCHLSYVACVPAADDIDCAGGNGNGLDARACE